VIKADKLATLSALFCVNFSGMLH